MGIPLQPAEPRGEKPADEMAEITRKADEIRRKESTLGKVKEIIAIHSGKGGVGKTFLSVNIAYALAEKGYLVGLLDADVDCPNVPKFLGMNSSLFVDSDKRFVPANHLGVKVVSMGLTREDETEPFLIRGPAKHRVTIDLLTNSLWGELDYLIIDMPPGTADVPLSLLEFGNVKGTIYVTTPQKEALIDTQKSMRMGKSFGTGILGVVENMSGIFGENEALKLCEEFDCPYLGTIPLTREISEMNSKGDIAFNHVKFEEIADRVLSSLI